MSDQVSSAATRTPASSAWRAKSARSGSVPTGQAVVEIDPCVALERLAHRQRAPAARTGRPPGRGTRSVFGAGDMGGKREKRGAVVHQPRRAAPRRGTTRAS